MRRLLLSLFLVAAAWNAEAVAWLKVSTAATVKLGPFVDSTDGVTAETALTISQADIRLSKNGGAFAQTNNAAGATHDENGWYGIPLNTTDTNTVGTLKVAVYESGALPVWEEYMVLPATVYDSLVGGTDNLPADVQEWKGSTAPANTGDAYARLGAPAGASVSADIAALPTATENADALLDRDYTTHITASTVGELYNNGPTTTELAEAFRDIDNTAPAPDGVGSVLNAVKAKTDNLPASPAAVGSPMALATNAVSAAAVAADAVTEIQSGLSTLTQANVRTAVGLASANLDTQLDDLASAIGSVAATGEYTYTETLTRSDTSAPLAEVHVWISTDSAGSNVIRSGYTDDFGVVTFELDGGTYYLWRSKAGFSWDNPKTITVGP